jgi:hypothetical protein
VHPTDEQQPACCALDPNHLALPTARACGQWNTRRLRDNGNAACSLWVYDGRSGWCPHMSSTCSRATESLKPTARQGTFNSGHAAHTSSHDRTLGQAIRHAHELERPVQRPRPNHESVLRHWNTLICRDPGVDSERNL